MDDGLGAYFSMMEEIAIEEGIPLYSGGLGVLAGNTLRAPQQYLTSAYFLLLQFYCKYHELSSV
ncbi:MAG: hypothetical protein ABIK92_12210 [Pseudomonadota bacterium]